MEKYVFYDLETTGTSPAFDQPLQFAAITTDLDFNELERIDIRCHLSPHILPSPQALAVTGVRPSQLKNSNLLSPFEFAQKIQEFTEKWAPAIWIGYNSIAFDEAMLRQMFYQNLQPNIFATQLHGNTRLDVMKMVFAVYAEVPDVLKWPLNEKGGVSFKLDQLAPENGFYSHNAHDALGDVEATIFIAKKIKKETPELYQKIFNARDKEQNLQLLKTYTPVEVTLRFGGHDPKTYVGCYCGVSNTNKNLIGFLNLETDNPTALINGTKEEISKAMTKSPLAIRSLRLNQAETIRPTSKLSTEWSQICSIVEKSPEFQDLVSDVLTEEYKQKDGPISVEERIFEAFYSNDDKDLLQEFQICSWPSRLAILNKIKDERIIQLGRRLIAFNANHLIDDTTNRRMNDYLLTKWTNEDERPKWATINTIKRQISELKKQGFDGNLLDEMTDFYKQRLMEKDHLLHF